MVLLQSVSEIANYYYGTIRMTTGVQCAGMPKVEAAWQFLVGTCWQHKRNTFTVYSKKSFNICRLLTSLLQQNDIQKVLHGAKQKKILLYIVSVLY